MTDLDRTESARITTAYRALHSYFIDYLMTMDDQDVATAIAGRAGGGTFQEFAEALNAQQALRCTYSVLPEGPDEVAIRIEVLGDDDQWHGVVRVLKDRLGLDVTPFSALVPKDLDEQIERLLDGGK